MEPIDQIDTVLLLMQKDRGHITFDHIITRLNSDDHTDSPIFYGDILRRIIHKLMKDGYVYEGISSTGVINYAITFDGFLFHGYREQRRLDTIKQTISESDQLARQRNDRLLVRGTWFAGIAAALLLAWYIFVWINPTYSDFPYVVFGILRKSSK